MARIAIMALEGIEEPSEDVSAEVNSSIGEIDSLNADIDQNANQVDEAADVQESASKIAGKLGEAVKTGEGISDKEAELVDVAIEHFCKRIGYKRQVMPSMEGFANKSTRLDRTKLALENLQEMQVRLNSVISIAQEGIIDSINTSIAMIFTTDKKVLDRLQKVSADYDSKTVKTEPIVNPTWGRYIKSTNAECNGAEVIKYLNVVDKASSVEVKDILNRLSSCLDGITNEVKDTWFVSNKKNIEQIEKLHSEIIDASNGLSDLVEGASAATKSKTFIPITAKEKSTITTLIQKVLEDNSLKEALKKLNSSKNSAISTNRLNNNIRAKNVATFAVGIPATTVASILSLSSFGFLGGLLVYGAGSAAIMGAMAKLPPEDLGKARKALKDVISIYKTVNELYKTRVKACNALVSYIEASAS